MEGQRSDRAACESKEGLKAETELPKRAETIPWPEKIIRKLRKTDGTAGLTSFPTTLVMLTSALNPPAGREMRARTRRNPAL